MPEKRGRGRPRKHDRAEQLDQLPAFTVPGDEHAIDTAGALDALDAAEATNDTPADAGSSSTSETAHTSTAETARDRSTVAAPAKAAPSAPATKSSSGRASLTGKQYRGVKMDQLKALLADRDNEVSQLRARVEAMAPAAAEANEQALTAALAVTFGAIGDVAAMFYGDACRLTDGQRKTLGDVWAPVIGPKLGEAAANLPIVAAVAQTGGIVFEKVMSVRAARALASAEPVEARAV
jgi:hypothetical protein